MSISISSNVNKWHINEYQQAFLAPLPGKVVRQEGNIDKLILTDVIEITIDLYSNRLTLVLSTFISYAG
jgi:hypothetical protein